MENKEKSDNYLDKDTDKFSKYPYKKDDHPVLFLHLEPWGQTLAISPVPVSDLNYAINEFADGTVDLEGKPETRTPGRLVVRAGVSKLHPDDRYSKSVGRKVSMDKIENTYAWVRQAIINSKGIMYVVQLNGSGITVNLMAKHGDDLAYPMNGYGS